MGMKIAVMLRHFEQKDGGVKIYTKRVLPLLFEIGREHLYLLLYKNPDLVGTYGNHPNVQERHLRFPGNVAWDQIAVSWIAAREKVDLIFNPKFTVPLVTGAKTAFVLHGSEWFAIPRHFLWYDRLYIRCAVPLYFSAADAVVAVSRAVKQDAVKHAGAEPSKITVVHNGFDPGVFRRVTDREQLNAIATKYRLPQRFILWVGQLESRKNIAGLLRAFALVKGRIPHQLVLAGAQRFAFPRAAGVEEDLRLVEQLGLEHRVLFLGWISHDDLPALYSLADLFCFPSHHEGFGIPLLEAMACGCPIVTANTCAPPEVAEGAALLVNPNDIDQIGSAMTEMIENASLRDQKVARGLERAQEFSWEKCAKELVAVFDGLATSTGDRARMLSPTEGDGAAPTRFAR